MKDDNNVWQKSSNAPTEKTAKILSFMFLVILRTATLMKCAILVKNGNEDQVTISTTQTQTEPKLYYALRQTGDCGTATATKTRKCYRSYRFSLQYRSSSSLSVFQPYTIIKAYNNVT